MHMSRKTYKLTYKLFMFCAVLGLPAAQEVPEHLVVSGAGVEGQIHGECRTQTLVTQIHSRDGPRVCASVVG